MRQHKILREIYEQFSAVLTGASAGGTVFTLHQGCPSPCTDKTPRLYLCVSDISQIQECKNGERIILNELQYEFPSIFQMLFTVYITGMDCADVLEACGAAIQAIKDMEPMKVTEYTWHGNEDGSVYLEPVIRPCDYRVPSDKPDFPCLALSYQIIAGINSEKGGSFKRIEKRDIRTGSLNNDNK